MSDAMATHDPSADVGDRQFLHEPGEIAVMLGPEQQMPMIGHEAKGADPHRRRFERAGQNTDKCRVVVSVGEQFAATHRAIENVINNTAGSVTGLSWHDDKLANGGRYVNIGPVPFIVFRAM